MTGCGGGRAETGRPGLLTEAARAASQLFLRARRHPAAVAVLAAASFDDLYQSVGSFEQVYAGIVDTLLRAAGQHGDVLYAVPGSPWVLERSVALLQAEGRVDLSVVAGLSFLELAWGWLGVDPVAAAFAWSMVSPFPVETAG